MLSIIIPAHNEALRIGRTLEDYTSYFSARIGHNFEIIVVINGCRDNTEEIVSEYSQRFNNVKIHHIKGRGKGRAIIAGMKVARGDLLAFTDADGATKAAELGKLFTHLGYSDGAIASRWLPQSVRSPRQSLSRTIVSRAWNILIRMILKLPYRDTQCGAKLFTRAAISTVINDLTINGFAFDIELLYRLKLKNLQVVEVPISWNNRELSTLNIFHCIPDMLRDLIKIKRLRVPQPGVDKLSLTRAYQSSDGFLPIDQERPLRNAESEAEVSVP